MNLDRAQLLLSQLSIKHRDLNTSVPFVFNPNQAKAHDIVKRFYAKHGNVRAIVLKARRVGMSSYWDSILWCHCLTRPQAYAKILAHQKDISKSGLFRVPRDLAVELNIKAKNQICEVFTQQIKFHHSSGESILDIGTAGSTGVGAGLTLTGLHLSEAARYGGHDSFLSILPAVSKAPDTMIVLESTAQGRVGVGKIFFEHWLSADPKQGRKWNGYQQVFLSWLDDPACVANPALADDAPATDLERTLMAKPFNASRAQIAWMRPVLEGECQGSELKFLQEYPHEPMVAFTSTGDPAFTDSELKYAYSTRIEEGDKGGPVRGSFIRSGNRPLFMESGDGPWRIYEKPQKGCWYYIGGDCARGVDSDTDTGTVRATGDFSAFGVINGTTGAIAAKYSEWVDPTIIADQADLVGRYYNTAMVNIELTGNLGLWAQKLLRDTYMYPNLYWWKGKDDKAVKPNQNQHVHGWETTSRTRDLLFATFRGALRDGMKKIPGGLVPRDPELIEQMDECTMSAGMRWEVEKGHDDVLMAFMLAVVAKAQWPPPNIMSYQHNVYETKGDQIAGALEGAKVRPQEDLRRALRKDWNMVFRPQRTHSRSMDGDY